MTTISRVLELLEELMEKVEKIDDKQTNNYKRIQSLQKRVKALESKI